MNADLYHGSHIHCGGAGGEKSFFSHTINYFNKQGFPFVSQLRWDGKSDQVSRFLRSVPTLFRCMVFLVAQLERIKRLI